MSTRWVNLSVVAALTVGCATLVDQFPTRPPQGRSPADIAQDRAQCEAYAKAQPRQHGDHYRACMAARSYAINVGLDHLGWTIGVVQTRPHDADAVMKDIELCDRRADNAKNADNVVLTPEQERSLTGPAPTSALGVNYQQRPNASRTLVACLGEHGYALAPWVPMN